VIQVAAGNHELEPLFTAYNARFAAMPFPAGSSGGPQWYSVNLGPIHLITLNSFNDYAAGSDQYKWLESDLAAIDRNISPWVIVQLHAPWYNSNKAHTNDGQLMRLTLEQAIFNSKVACVFAGHVHAYERSLPSFNLQPNNAGPVYVTIGDGGNREGLYTSWISPQPSWSAFRDSQYGHGELRIENATHALWQWMRNADPEPQATDSTWITNPYHVA
jgi:hypothetical protein